LPKDKPLITSTTKVADLLKSYPELEDVLIAMAVVSENSNAL